MSLTNKTVKNKQLLYSIIAGIVITCFAASSSFAQNDSLKFRNYQFSFGRVSQASKEFNDTLSKEFRKKGLAFPPKDIYLRVFKSQNEMELWARNKSTGKYRFIKTYHICALSGSLGPKRFRGDNQVPEGYYFIEGFNPKSNYYMALHLNYPNYSDSIMGKGDLGGDIYIHGGCVTVGCMPMTDEGIKELYTICLDARLNGEKYIPVHIFPTHLTRGGINYLRYEYPNDPARQQFWAQLKAGYDYFEKYHKLLPVMYSPDGKYVD